MSTASTGIFGDSEVCIFDDSPEGCSDTLTMMPDLCASSCSLRMISPCEIVVAAVMGVYDVVFGCLERGIESDRAASSSTCLSFWSRS